VNTVGASASATLATASIAPAATSTPWPTKGPQTTQPPVTPGVSTSTGSGVSGSVVAGPTCPVERPGHPCPPRPVTDATVTAKPGGKSTHTDGHGDFLLKLSPGTYDLTVSSRSVMHCSDQRVQVTARHYTHVTLSCDTGIR
jgi:hypothetical protein